jgi:hypothetical protein
MVDLKISIVVSSLVFAASKVLITAYVRQPCPVKSFVPAGIP